MYGDIQPQEGAGAPRHSPDVSLRGAKRRGNLGKALPIYTECRRTQSLSNLTVAALSERHGGLQYAPHCLYGARLSDLSLRGAKRRGNLAEPDRTTGKSSAKSQLPSRDCHVGLRPPRNDKSGGRCGRRGTQKFATANGAQGTPLQTQSVHTILTAACTNCKCLPEIATAPLGPRNDKLEGLAPQNACRKDCQPARRSLSAATDAIGTCYFIDALYGLQMPSRDCHVGLRPPRNDKPLVSTILTTAC